jgi:hypothetical protein
MVFVEVSLFLGRIQIVRLMRFAVSIRGSGGLDSRALGFRTRYIGTTKSATNTTAAITESSVIITTTTTVADGTSIRYYWHFKQMHVFQAGGLVEALVEVWVSTHEPDRLLQSGGDVLDLRGRN